MGKKGRIYNYQANKRQSVSKRDNFGDTTTTAMIGTDGGDLRASIMRTK